MNTRSLRARNLFRASPHDTDLIKRIGIAFTTRPRIAWHDIHVAVSNAIVTLRGEVPTIYDRQLIVAVTRHVAGVRLVEDQIDVAELPVRQAEPRQEENSSPVRRADDDSNAETPRNKFSHLPVLAESLEDILAARQPNPIVAR